MTKLQEEIHELIIKARKAGDSADAMRFSQAACNSANALATLEHIKRAEK